MPLGPGMGVQMLGGPRVPIGMAGSGVSRPL